MVETYTLTKPKVLDRQYEIHRGAEDAGRLAFEGVLDTTARGVLHDHAWTFMRAGIMKPAIVIRRAGDTTEPMVIPLRLAGSCDVPLDGRIYRWKATSILKGELAWVDPSDAVVIRYRVLSLTRATRAIDVEVDLTDETKSLLVLLGGYLLALQSADIAGVTAAVAAAASVG